MALLYHDPEENTQTLQNLCLVNRHLHSMAEPILYHFPRINSYTRFFRTLQERPDLAAAFKVQKWVYDNNTYEKPDPAEDIWKLRNIAAALGLQDTSEEEFEDTYEHYPYGDPYDCTGTGRYMFSIAFDNLITSLIIALCPRLEFLSINLDDARMDMRGCFPEEAKYPYLRGLLESNPKGLPNLHTLVLQNTLHHDPNVLGIDRIAFMWPLFPNVQRLVFFRGTSETHELTDVLVPEGQARPEHTWAALPGLKELRFVRYGRSEMPLPMPAIQKLVSRCTGGLEKFIFSPLRLYGQNTFAPSKLLQILSPTTVSTLRHLTVNWSPMADEAAVDADELIGPELQRLQHLQSLVLDQAIFCHHHHHHQDSERDGDCLTSILPPSLQQLTINMDATLASLVDIIALGKAVSSPSQQKEYRNLSYIRIQVLLGDEYWGEADSPVTLDVYNDEHREERRPAETQTLGPLLPPNTVKQQLREAFAGTSVVLDIDFYRPGPCSQPLDSQFRPAEPLDEYNIKLVDAE